MISIIVINIVISVILVVIHYQFLFTMTTYLPTIDISARHKIMLGVFGALIAHAIEVWVYAIVYYFMINDGHWGTLIGTFDGSMLDCVYFSFTTFTTVGFGDISPQGLIRHLIGIESLIGLVLITWTASFLFLEMQRNWKVKG